MKKFMVLFNRVKISNRDNECRVIDDIFIIEAVDNNDAFAKLEDVYYKQFGIKPSIGDMTIKELDSLSGHIYSNNTIIDFDKKVKERIKEYKERVNFYDNGDYDDEEEYEYLMEQHHFRTLYHRNFLENAEKYFNGEMTQKEFCREMHIRQYNDEMVECIEDWNICNLSYDDYEEYIYGYDYDTDEEYDY